MLLAHHLLNLTNDFLNAANLSFLHRSCLVLASSKYITAFMKTRQLEPLLAENIGLPPFRLKIRLSFRKFYPSKSLPYEIPKTQTVFL